jgi:ABC-type Fe3+ transport system permease subunit/DNA-binding beta-propeller fold protein YncE
MSLELLTNSLLVAMGVTMLGGVLGFAAAIWTCAQAKPLQRLMMALAIISLSLPSFVQANCWLELLGNNGIWRNWLPTIYSLPGAVWLLTLSFWPISFGFAFAACRSVDSAFFEVEPRLRGISLLRHLLWPASQRALLQAAILTFVLALNNFTIPALLQVRVLPAQVWIQFETNLNVLLALLRGLPLILAPIALLCLWRDPRSRWSVHANRSFHVFCRQLGPGCMLCASIVSAFLATCSVALPMAQLLGSSRTWNQLPVAWFAAAPVFWNTLLLAFASSSICLVFGLLLARRWGRLLWLFFFVPGILLGILLVTVFNHGPFDVIYRSAFIIVIAWGIRYCGIGWNSAAAAKSAIPTEQTEAALVAGASHWQIFRYVQAPLLLPNLAVGWYLIYLLCLWDIETIILVLPPGGETLAVRIFGLLHYGHNAQVNALCLLILALALAPFVAWSGIVAARRKFSVAAISCGLMIFAIGCKPSQEFRGSRLFKSVEIIGRRGAGAGEFNKPRSLAIDRMDNLYVVDMTGRVQKFSPEGKFLLSWQMPQTDLGKPKGMCLDENGNIVVVEPHYQRVNHFSTEGKLLFQWGKSGTNAGELTLPRSVAVNSRGETFVTEYTRVDRVQGFKGPDKKAFVLIGRPGDGPGEFNRAEGICSDSKDQLYVADSCNHRIQVFSSGGKWLRSHGRPGKNSGEMSYPYDVRVDASGMQFVCEFGNSRVQVFDSLDQPFEILGGAGAQPGQFSNPWSIALNSRGDLYVCDAGNHRVQKFVRE